MKENKKSVYLLVLGLLLFCSWIPQQVADIHIPQQIAEKGRNSTVLLVHLSANGPGSGSGFFVEPDKIVTNIHVVAAPTIVLAVGTETVYTIEGVIASDPKQDLVILKVSGQGEPLPLAIGQIGDPVFVVGYPAGGYKIGENAIHGIRNSDKQIRFTRNYKGTMIAPGNSGGPALNLRGEVIGIVTLGDESNSYAYASPSNALKLLIARVGPVEPLSEWQRKPTIQAYAYKRWGVEKFWSYAPDEAVKALDKAIELYPNFREAYQNRGSAKAALGSFEGARGDFEAARRHYNEAIADYTKVIDFNTDYTEAYYNRGNAKRKLLDYEMAQGDEGDFEAARRYYNEAIADYTKAIDLNTDYTEAYYNRGIAKATLGSFEGARGDFEAARRHYNEAIADYTKVLELEPRDAEAYYVRGVAKIVNRDYEAAIADYTKAIDLNTDYTKAYYNRGVTKAALGSFEGARGDFEAARRHYNEAIADYTKVLELEPRDAEAYYNRGVAKEALGRDEEAKQDYATYYYYLGRIDNNRGHYQAAIDKFDEVLKLKSDYAEVYLFQAEAKKNFGQSKRTSGDTEAARNLYQEAIDDSTQAIILNKDYAEAYYVRGLTKLLRGDHGDYQSAIVDFNIAIENRAIGLDMIYGVLGLAKCLLGYRGSVEKGLGQYNEAIAALNEAIKLEPDDAVYYQLLGIAKASLGENKEAIAAFETAKKRGADVGK